MDDSRPPHVDEASWKVIQQLHGGSSRRSSSRRRGLAEDETCPSRTRSGAALDGLSSTQLEAESIKLARQLMAREQERLQKENEESLRLAKQLLDQEKQETQLRKQQEEQSARTAATIYQQDLLVRSTDSYKRDKRHALSRLEPCQIRALEYIQNLARQNHQRALPALREHVGRKGWNGLSHCLEYIRTDAPIVIHFPETLLETLCHDTHYRSLFETNTSGGTRDKRQRARWEDSLFGQHYRDCVPSERPKYGCVNITGDIQGVSPARRYGKCFITLQPHVRHRTTFCDMDTGQCFEQATLATNENYAHVLLKYPDADLQSILSVSRLRGDPNVCRQYKEAQIHGPIDLEKDVQTLSVPGSAATYEFRHVVAKLQQKTKCAILWQHDLLNGT